MPTARSRLQQAWNVGQRVREKLQDNPRDPGLVKALKVTDETFKQVKNAELQSYLHEFIARTAESIRKKAVGMLANGKAVGTDNLCGEP